jgi:hypothetical protein
MRSGGPMLSVTSFRPLRALANPSRPDSISLGTRRERRCQRPQTALSRQRLRRSSRLTSRNLGEPINNRPFYAASWINQLRKSSRRTCGSSEHASEPHHYGSADERRNRPGVGLQVGGLRPARKGSAWRRVPRSDGDFTWYSGLFGDNRPQPSAVVAIGGSTSCHPHQYQAANHARCRCCSSSTPTLRLANALPPR